MSLFKWLFRAQWDCLLEQGRQIDADETKIRELRTALVASRDACGIWRGRAEKVEKATPRPMSEAPDDVWIQLVFPGIRVSGESEFRLSKPSIGWRPAPITKAP